jgi:2-hydroxychromene-2-carboxylate isomerase
VTTTFYFDLGSPYAYLAAERVDTVLPEPVHWQPVLLGGLFKLTGRSSWAVGNEGRRQAGIIELERRARDYGLPPFRWPEQWPSNYLTAMRATTYACSQGLGREFALRAFRSAFQRGVDLSVAENVDAVAVQVGLDRAGLQAALADPEVKDTLRAATDAAHDRGVFGVPTIAVGDELFWGDDHLEDAATLLR